MYAFPGLYMPRVGSRQASLNKLIWRTLLCYLLCSGDKIFDLLQYHVIPHKNCSIYAIPYFLLGSICGRGSFAELHSIVLGCSFIFITTPSWASFLYEKFHFNHRRIIYQLNRVVQPITTRCNLIKLL